MSGGHILVAAGTNGAGKSSIVQPYIEALGGAYYNPDRETRSLIAAGMTDDQANARAWAKGHEALRAAIDDDTDFAFETTLGARTISFEMMRALAMDRLLSILFVGLASAELHIQRVEERVRRGGHAIAETKIRERYQNSRLNLLAFIGTRAHIRVWDNSTQTTNGQPHRIPIFEMKDRKLRLEMDVRSAPRWTHPLLARAMKFAA